MDPHLERRVNLSRRHFLGRAGVVGVAALAELLQSDLLAQTPAPTGLGGAVFLIDALAGIEGGSSGESG